nr:hypothetical protein [Klebsiella pneumoniae]
MTDITELAQSEINDALAQLKQISEYPTPSTQYARVLRKYILALEKALEKAQKQTTESENRVRKQNRHICELFDDNTALRQRIAELESRTVTVKLPDINEYLEEVHDKTLNRAFRLLAEGVRAGDVAAMRAAGIKVEAE